MNRQLKLGLNSSICILLNSLEMLFFLFVLFLFFLFFFFCGWCCSFCRLSSCYQYLGRFFLFFCPCCGVEGGEGGGVDPFQGGDTYLMDTNRSLRRRGRHPSVSGSGNPSVATNVPFSSLQRPAHPFILCNTQQLYQVIPGSSLLLPLLLLLLLEQTSAVPALFR